MLNLQFREDIGDTLELVRLIMKYGSDVDVAMYLQSSSRMWHIDWNAVEIIKVMIADPRISTEDAQNTFVKEFADDGIRRPLNEFILLQKAIDADVSLYIKYGIFDAASVDLLLYILSIRQVPKNKRRLINSLLADVDSGIQLPPYKVGVKQLTSNELKKLEASIRQKDSWF
jgi:hypothetical protein